MDMHHTGRFFMGKNRLPAACGEAVSDIRGHSTVTDFARFLGLSTSRPLAQLT